METAALYFLSFKEKGTVLFFYQTNVTSGDNSEIFIVQVTLRPHFSIGIGQREQNKIRSGMLGAEAELRRK